MKTRLVILIAAVLLLATGCTLRWEAEEPAVTPAAEETARPVPTPALPETNEPVRTGVTILVEGVVQAGQPLLPLAFETGGKLQAVYVEAGDDVAAGDLIARLDDTRAQDEVARAQLNLEQAEQDRSNLESQREDRVFSLERAELALEQAEIEASQAITSAQTSLDKAWDDLEAARTASASDLDAARGAVANASANLENARLNLIVTKNSDVVAKNVRDREYEANWHEVSYGEYQKKYQRGEIDKTRLDLEYNNLVTAKERLSQAQARASLALGEADARASEAEEALRQARARLVELENEHAVSAAQAALDQAALNYQRAVQNADPASPNMRLLALDVERAGRAVEDLASADNAVAQAGLALESAQRELTAVELRSPADGTVTSVDAVPGTLVGTGSPIATLLDESELEFHTTNLSERDLAQISPGQAAVVTLKAYADDPIQASVAGIGLQAGAVVGDAATFPVILALGETDQALRPGMTGRAEIYTGE